MCKVGRIFLLTICTLQMLTIIERQIFDFLGFMWAPILVNFFHIIFVIFGIFGAYQFRAKYLISYSVWNVIWIGWNVFLICFYLNVGILDRDSDLLNLGTGSVSWFEVNGYGCVPTFPTNITSEDPYRPIRPERVDGCLVDYHLTEAIHSGVQSFLAILGLIGAICLGTMLCDDDDSFDFMGGDAKSPQHTSLHPMYVSYTSLPQSATSTQINHNNHNNLINNNNSQFGVVLKSINNSNTNSLSSTYLNNNHSNNKLASQLHKPASHYQLVDHHQLNNSGSHNSLTGYYNKTNLSKSASSNQVLMKRNPSFNSNHRSDIRYTEIIAATDDFLNKMSTEDLMGNNNSDNGSRKSFLINSPGNSSPVTKRLLSNNNSPQNYPQGRQFGIQNPLNNLIKINKLQSLVDEDSQSNSNSMEYGSNNSTLLIGHAPTRPLPPIPTQPPLPPLPPPPKNITQNYSFAVRQEIDLNKYLNSQKASKNQENQEKQEALDKVNNLPYQFVARSPNLSRISRRRLSQQQQQQQQGPQPVTGYQLGNSNSSSKLSSINYDLIRDQMTPPRYNFQNTQTIFEDPNAVVQLHRAKSQDRLSQRLRRQSNQPNNGKQNQRPRSFCSNNMINYNDYKDYN